MPHAVELLELIGEAALPVLGEPGGPVAADRVAREVWGGWARARDADARRADLDEMRQLPDEAVVDAVAAIVKRLLPGRPGPIQAALGRYLHALPDLLRHRVIRGVEQADELARWLPAILPRYQVGDAPPGVGDRRLQQLLRADGRGECWLATNPRLAERPGVVLAFVTDDRLPRAVAWHVRAMRGPATGLLPLEHTYPGCLQFAAPPPDPLTGSCRDPGVAHARLYREVVATAALLHRRAAPVALGALEPGDVFATREGRTQVLVTEGPANEDVRADVLALGRLGRQLGLDQDEYLSGVLISCVAEDPLRRPADAHALLARLEQGGPLARAAPAATPAEPARQTTAPKRGRVWDVLAGLEASGGKQEKRIVNSAGMTFVLVQKGSFPMGSPPGEVGRRDNEGPVHEVILPSAFYLGAHPVTQEQYLKVIGRNPARFQGAAGGGPTHPVECVSWDDAVAFCQALGGLAAEREAKRTYRLPTEAEWEYACRAGTTTPFHYGGSLSATQARFDGAYPYGDGARTAAVPRTAAVGSFQPNHWGLYDMHGNVWEWCADWFDDAYYQRSPRQAPGGPEGGLYRVLRGGSWRNQAIPCRSAYRNALPPNQRQPFIGVRVVMEMASE